MKSSSDKSEMKEVSKNYKKMTMQELTKVADEGDEEAMVILANHLLNTKEKKYEFKRVSEGGGLGSYSELKNYPNQLKAFTYLYQPAMNNNVQALKTLINFGIKEEHIFCDKRHLEFFEKYKSLPKMERFQGLLILWCTGPDREKDKIESEINQLVIQWNEPEAMLLLGDFYYHWDKNAYTNGQIKSKAFSWYEKAAQLGNGAGVLKITADNKELYDLIRDEYGCVEQNVNSKLKRAEYFNYVLQAYKTSNVDKRDKKYFFQLSMFLYADLHDAYILSKIHQKYKWYSYSNVKRQNLSWMLERLSGNLDDYSSASRSEYGKYQIFMSKTKREKESFKKTFNIDKHLNYWLQDFQEHNLKDIRDEARVFIPIVKKLIDDQLSQKKTSSVDDTKLIARAYIAWVENTKDSNQKIAEMLSQLSNPMSLSQSNIDPKCLYMLINELNKNPKLFSKYLSALECKLIVLLNLSYLSKQGGELDIFNLNLNTVVSDKNQLDEKKVSSSEQSKFQTENDFIDSFDSTINVENYRLLFVNLLTELSAELKELTKRKIESYKPSFFSNREDKSQEKLVSLNQLVSKIASLDLNDKQYLINLRIINNEINSHIIKGSFPESFGLLNHIKCAAQEIIATYDSNKDIKKSLTLEDLDKRVYNIIQKFVQSEELFDDYSIRNPENSKYGDLFDIVVGYTNIMYSNFFRHKSFEKNEKIKLLTNLIADDEHDSLFNLKYGIQTYLDKESNKKDAKNENKIKLAKYYLKLVDDAVDEVNNLLREIRQENEEEKKVEPKKTQKNKEISSFEEIVNNLNTMIQSTGQPSLSIDEDEEKLMSAYNKFHKNFDNDFLANQHSRESLNEILKQYLNKIPNTIKIIELIASKINKEDNDMFRRIQEKYQICISQLNLMKESITNSINDLSTLSAAKETKEKSSNQTISLSSPDSQKDVMKNSRIAKFQRK